MARKLLLFAGGAAVSSAVFYGVLALYRRSKLKTAVKRKVDCMMSVLDQSNIYIRDPAVLRGTLKTIAEDGDEKLQVLSDFDMTLSKYWVNGKRGETCHGVVEKASCMPKAFKTEIAALKAKFYPLEMSPDLSREQKVPLMVEWWSNAHRLIIGTEMKDEWIVGMVSEALIELRDGTPEFIEYLRDRKIPLVVFSAGVGDVIEEVLLSSSCPIEGLKIISNYMDFDGDGKIIGFKTELIHSYNKHDISVHWHDYFDQSRKHHILLGDTIGDTSMADGLDDNGCLLKIGFLNDRVEELLPSYQQAYDVVICDDQTMYTINALLEEMFT